ncbi:Carboxysome shell and ethanolamine utilization microcompartment protein CcmL/EutN [Geosporobacter subterraneus DSM 17957]|uniref:Carboxysome shell and ethanolamine utilization microcompartment protein CcmL/EutN n=1 Tax=Geosporobacter subterraneus DSM 17957 TaxID=1121919 RepID=A0A1M6HTW7_9FIRM|nr:BMC domain-containing protein [Geosporobacter subterraneus]SHJ25613.1 Carboxysome shell and ethanolamine utilization microcompartment protein CcmL/EutN [Geosporobacter subterraneus DSM 17957]
MKKSLGLIEYKSIAKGIEATDEMLKAANVELILSTPICPGKYISLIGGDVGAVKTAVRVGRDIGSIFTVDDFVIPNVHPQVFPALTATADISKIISLGVIETMSAVASVMAGDIAVKAANIELLEIRLARGLGGKGFVVITGEISSVKSAVQACENQLMETGQIVSAVVIAAPHKDLIPKVL